MKVLWGQY
jgi:hypothetical protein